MSNEVSLNSHEGLFTHKYQVPGFRLLGVFDSIVPEPDDDVDGRGALDDVVDVVGGLIPLFMITAVCSDSVRGFSSVGGIFSIRITVNECL